MSKTRKTGTKEVGFVIQSQDYLLFLEGLPTTKLNDVIVDAQGHRAIITALEEEKIEAWMLDNFHSKPGDSFTVSPEGLRLALQYNLFGRTISPLGLPLDGKPGLPPGGVEIDLDLVAPGIDSRELITEQFYTGLIAVDTLLPIGKGQRELLYGEPRSGKTPFLLDIIIHQKVFNRICIYCAMGRSEIDIKRFAENLIQNGGSSYTVIIAASSSDSAPLIAIAPAMASSVAEHYRDQGKDVLLILDDLATHAKYMREISLLAGRIPGRESYPADIFYQHSHLVERAGNFSDKKGKGSITLLPVIETDLESFSSLIPTNVMSMTDGHLLFSASLRAQGQYPAIEIDRSVTRVGRQTQKFIHKVLSDRIRSLLADFHELQRFSRFGTELTGQTQLIIKRGKITEELIRQDTLTYIPPSVQILLLSLVFSGFFDEKDINWVKQYKQLIIKELAGTTAKKISESIDKIELDVLIENLKSLHKELENKCQPLPNSKKN
ncbi:hypothetical protein A3D05_01470 [Candidatus Gottesmanbacteria bacterium RIFCSPHIGHO2_02_FULL_40_24]|uniref:ATPase F1/V1/A1 complex alpha/beta subunit nucleotide-binding domain-containing protein n=1 Tax=Candidatus Gottesmanbacteria bacterium RIFCSPHIGHO2_01_FULL_40_15 TaxID=1798376 RepID=A0A1F5YZG5_9BACT|nr:MAG: hypothetical protein A2777_04375 [Candidatus Gottesmanbacteria bacterium RIFCSPHIGHO2_01_FULL_40_15]OGG16340.1 MAG: hypothetical protein A3D05_01470 [Candidatus Gottesmanbacteria bacterium RIFCSPHIGHO2_02_FULL_40_24]OGG22686.1 MAG: hypothetical protein A3B48_05105 [Candidatus Gottesmanbacteria bacterium RIFCSPLOWO2_01_FULL_40_10]OGG23460.1 MAG: hypothetical protein A3E42_00260 [Candidatus Gottesmanbacteria bacterium RIFCSPHIGHO2_12_FULL_40_13]OGG33059.1 MAG: hypothetical protein A3I80_0